VSARRAVFFDRDGVLNAAPLRAGKPVSPRVPAELHIEADAPDAASRLRAQGFLLFAVTNQPDVARGHLDRADLDDMMRTVAYTVKLDDYRVCTHDDVDGCGCRKPRPGMITELAATWRVDLQSSWVVGDTVRDVQAGRAAGCTTVLLRRPYNLEIEADVVVSTLEEAAARIVERSG
jgi:D-glycero-D-manno-heptose 1,7-bisphosphate phosphatase